MRHRRKEITVGRSISCISPNTRWAADQQTWREAAHTLKGSARGIGAWHVADIVDSLEKISDDEMRTEKDHLVEGLQEVVTEANDFIDQLLTRD